MFARGCCKSDSTAGATTSTSSFLGARPISTRLAGANWSITACKLRKKLRIYRRLQNGEFSSLISKLIDINKIIIFFILFLDCLIEKLIQTTYWKKLTLLTHLHLAKRSCPVSKQFQILYHAYLYFFYYF